jgi:glycosyltransferase involved in cell wall biosynthesis
MRPYRDPRASVRKQLADGAGVTAGSVNRHVVVVPYYYPPFPGSGNRWPALARYLRLAGHEVTILATDLYGRLDHDHEVGVVRVSDLRSAKPLRRLLRRGDTPVAGATSPETAPPALLTKVLVPDAYIVSWLPAALVSLRRILARSTIDALVTSGPPDSMHLLGLLLGRRRPAWIADFRDGWCFEPLREPFPTAPQRALDRWLERRVAQTADVAVGATKPIAHDLSQRLGAQSAYVPNAWDPKDEPEASPPSAPPNDSVRLVYTGTLSGVRGSSPGPFLRALRIVRGEADSPRIQLVLAGRLTSEERHLIEESGIADAVSYLGRLERRDALALQRSADALLLLTSRNSSEATGKLFEYLGADRPILALADGNEAARIVQETNTGITVPPDNVEAIAGALRLFASGELANSYAPRDLHRFTHPGPAEKMAELVEEAIDRHRRKA